MILNCSNQDNTQRNRDVKTKMCFWTKQSIYGILVQIRIQTFEQSKSCNGSLPSLDWTYIFCVFVLKLSKESSPFKSIHVGRRNGWSFGK